MNDKQYMNLALRLAKRGTGFISPNPRVGAVIVKNGKVIGQGFHAKFGGPHAEASALSGLNPDELKGATFYVNLEPCCHFGKTPPCTEAIIRSGIGRVVVGMQDPNPLVAGKGIKSLRKAGIDVTLGVLESECGRFNEAFAKWITKHRPFITLKIAQTLDGKIALQNGRSKWITGESSRRKVQHLRAEHDAVLVGIGTVLADDPELTVRSGQRIRPKRIVLDTQLRIPDHAKVIHQPDPERTILVAGPGAPPSRRSWIRSLGATVWTVENDSEGRIHIDAFMKKAGEEGLTSILVEGGKAVFSGFLKSGMADRLVCFTAPRLFGDGFSSFSDLGVDTPSDAIGFEDAVWKRCGQDMMFEGKPCLRA
jgi:diaminohydroxyphosphoribosylaminopyrimidine deaminase / 5-amino-6-(5-phosphoribosylamino)uracil reductase